MSPKQHRYWRGVLLYSICEYLELNKNDYEKASRRLHIFFKEMFEVDSFSDLDSKSFEKIAGKIRVIFAREYSWIIPTADEADYNPNELTMKEFLEKKNLV